MEHAKQRPKYIYLAFGDRSCGNKMLYSMYKMFMIFNNTVWYYFSPFAFRFVIYFFLFKKNVEVSKDRASGEAAAAL